MTTFPFSDDELLAYLDEQLPVPRMAEIEGASRQSALLRNHLASLLRSRDSGEHTVGEVWRRGRLSCPTRSQLQEFLARTLEADWRNYIDFHLHTVGCRYCLANLEDLEAALSSAAATEQRRKKFFQSSAGRLRTSSTDP
jgi:hypothetical protein